jgi:hypothetical protein
MKHFLVVVGIVVFCLGIAFFDKHAPDATGIEVHIKPEESGTLTPAIDTALDRVLSFYATKHDITFDGPLHIIFSQDSTFVGDKYYELSRPHVSRKNARYFARNHCDADQTVSGVITLKVMLMCISPIDTISPAWVYQNQSEIDITLAHEIMHSLQHQFTAEKVGGIKGNRPSGPIWMSEGTANYMMYDFTGAMGNKRAEFERLFDRASGADKSIAELHHAEPFKRFEYYGVSHLAAFMLIERFGAPAMFDYWRNIGDGHSWGNSFARAFLFPMDDFEAQFATLRHDRDAAWNWSNMAN